VNHLHHDPRSSDVGSSALSAVGDLVFELTPSGEFVRYLGARALLHVPPERFLGRPLGAVLPAPVSELISGALAEVLETGVPKSVRYGLVVNGRERHFEARVAPAPNGNAFALVRDVHAETVADKELERAETLRRESENRFRVMADYAPVLLWMSDTTSLCTFFNQRWLEFTGRTLAEEWGNGWAEGIHFEDFQHAMHVYMTAFVQHRPFSMEYRLRRADGQYRWIYDQGTPRFEADGTFAGFIGSCVDITERYEAHQALRRMNEELQAANQAKSEFLANMSHELRTPLNSIIGFTDLMYRGEVGPVDQTHREYLGDILTSSRHLLALINGVLDLAKIEAGRLDLRLESVDATSVAREVCDLMRSLAADRDINLAVETDPTLGLVTVDPDRLRQMLFNYVSNAIKFGKSGTQVVVRVHSSGEQSFRVEVEDQGMGIASEDVQRLFRDFEQLDSGSAKKHAGTGLGLALTKRLAEAHGGEVGAQSAPGRGSVFWAVLPRNTGSTSERFEA
jgi:PAS domain S-box-containing protein